MTTKPQPDPDRQDQSADELTKVTEHVKKPRLFDGREETSSNEDRPPDIVVEN